MTAGPADRRRTDQRRTDRRHADRRGPARGLSARLEIDWTRCDGHGLCAALLPAAIGRDEWGYPVLDRVALASVGGAAVNRVVAACPALALRRVDAAGGVVDIATADVAAADADVRNAAPTTSR